MSDYIFDLISVAGQQPPLPVPQHKVLRPWIAGHKLRGGGGVYPGQPPLYLLPELDKKSGGGGGGAAAGLAAGAAAAAADPNKTKMIYHQCYFNPISCFRKRSELMRK